MRVLVIGAGGREHALVWKLSCSQSIKEIYAAPGNGGISEIANCVEIKPQDIILPSSDESADEKSDDVLLALPSNGLHTNGYSLVRKIFFEIILFMIRIFN